MEERNVPSIAKYIKSKQCRQVFVMLGAGVSTAAGIPDFRSPGTGLYSNLQRFNLPYPEAVFDIEYFRENPRPFYMLAQELYPGRFRPTRTHTFVKLLAEHALLDTCLTQNIDTLERRAGIPPQRIVEAHGSFADQHCIECDARFDSVRMKAAVERSEVIRCDECTGLVKPDIVFFGEALPELFHTSISKLRQADLLIVIGTSLKVHPFASLTGMVPKECPRILINMEPAGDIGMRPDDVVLLGRCDEIIQELARELGWEEELTREWEKTKLEPGKQWHQKPDVAGGLAEAEAQETRGPDAIEIPVPSLTTKKGAEDARVEAEVETLAAQIGKALHMSSEGGGEEEAETPTSGTTSPSQNAPVQSSATSEKPPVAEEVASAPSETSREHVVGSTTNIVQDEDT